MGKGGKETAAAKFLGYVWRRCNTGYPEKDKQKIKRVNEDTSIKEWKEVLDGRFALPQAGEKAWVMLILKIAIDKRTPKGHDLSDRPATLNLLTEWCDRKQKEKGYELTSEESNNFLEITRRMDARREDVQARQEHALPIVPSAQPYRPHGDERIPKRARTALEIMTQAGKHARKTFDERMTKAEEEARKTMANAEEEARNALE